MHTIKKGQMVAGDSKYLSAAEQFYSLGCLESRKGSQTSLEGN
jgi:hypothetical protein